MNIEIDSSGPKLASVPSNPIPDKGRVGYFSTSDKVRLRYGIWARTAGGAKGTVCLVHGRTEYIEKYFETIADFQKRGFAVATFDWRGQGGSERLIGNPRLGYVDTFDDYLCDVRSFHSAILLPDCPPPYYLVGHSMGGLVSLFAAAHDRLMFDRIFLTAPMVSLEGQPFSMGVMARIAETLSFAGIGALPIRRRADLPPSEQSFAGNPLTSDPVRFMRSVATVKSMPDLEISSPTIRWVAAAARAMDTAARDAFPGSIRAPVLMLAAARDEVVSTRATEQLGLRMRSGRHVVVATARHELFMENDAIRAQVFAAFDAFVTELTTP